MDVTLASMFRDSVDDLGRYFDQIEALDGMIDVRLVIAEGDSVDNTYNELDGRIGRADTLLKVDHGGVRYPSVDTELRWAKLAYVCNTIMEHVPDDAPLIYVESDLIWDAQTMLRLLDHLEQVPAVAPMCFQDERFYDTFGHRGLDGQRFHMFPPYHPDLEFGSGLVEIGSAGSCVAMRAEVIPKARFGDNDCIVGLGRSIRENGFSFWLDPTLKVLHP
jgi:hypothetical protein